MEVIDGERGDKERISETKSKRSTINLLKNNTCHNCRFNLYFKDRCMLVGNKPLSDSGICEDWVNEDVADGIHYLTLNDEADIAAFEAEGLVVEMHNVPSLSKVKVIEIYVDKPQNCYLLRLPVNLSKYVNAIKINSTSLVEIYYSNRKIKT